MGLLEQVARLEAQTRVVSEATGPLEDVIHDLQKEVEHWKARGQVLELLLENTPLDRKFFSIHSQLSEIEHHLSAVESATEHIPKCKYEKGVPQQERAKSSLFGRFMWLIFGEGNR